MANGDTKVKMQSVIDGVTGKITITGYRQFHVRCWLGVVLVKLAAWCFPINMGVNLEVDSRPEQTRENLNQQSARVMKDVRSRGEMDVPNQQFILRLSINELGHFNALINAADRGDVAPVTDRPDGK